MRPVAHAYASSNPSVQQGKQRRLIGQTEVPHSAAKVPNELSFTSAVARNARLTLSSVLISDACKPLSIAARQYP